MVPEDENYQDDSAVEGDKEFEVDGEEMHELLNKQIRTNMNKKYWN